MCKNYFIFVNGSPNAFVWDLIFPLDNISPYKYNIHWKTSLFCTRYVSGARVATFKRSTIPIVIKKGRHNNQRLKSQGKTGAGRGPERKRVGREPGALLRAPLSGAEGTNVVVACGRGAALARAERTPEADCCVPEEVRSDTGKWHKGKLKGQARVKARRLFWHVGCALGSKCKEKPPAALQQSSGRMQHTLWAHVLPQSTCSNPQLMGTWTISNHLTDFLGLKGMPIFSSSISLGPSGMKSLLMQGLVVHLLKARSRGTSLVVQRICLPMQGTQVQALVGQLRPYMPWGN